MSNALLRPFRERIGVPQVSDWLTVTQEMIDRFAEATGDHQFIHVDPVRASRTELGGTIAHGFLTLSLFPTLAETVPGALIGGEGFRMGLNYGCNRLRFLNPVRSGARVRGRFTTLEVAESKPGQALQTIEFVVEIEAEERPALAAEWMVAARY